VSSLPTCRLYVGVTRPCEGGRPEEMVTFPNRKMQVVLDHRAGSDTCITHEPSFELQRRLSNVCRQIQSPSGPWMRGLCRSAWFWLAGPRLQHVDNRCCLTACTQGQDVSCPVRCAALASPRLLAWRPPSSTLYFSVGLPHHPFTLKLFYPRSNSLDTRLTAPRHLVTRPDTALCCWAVPT